MLTFLVIFLIFLGLFTEELYRYVFCRNSSKLFLFFFDAKGHLPEYYRFREEKLQAFQKLSPEVCTIQSDRGQTLKGYYYSFGGNGKKIAFVVHGYRSDHADTASIVYDYYKSRNIDIFCCDHTAEGDSEGHFIGFDVLESRDCLKWLDFLGQKFPDAEILLHGFSMGGATVLQMSSHCPKSVKFIIADSAYENAYASMHHQIGPFYTPLRFLNRLIAGYDWKDSDVKASLLNCRLPILFVHGQDDKLVPYPNGPKLHSLYPGPKDSLFPPHTRHIESMYTSPTLYAQKIDGFLREYF